jgi:glucose-1-phosphatase
MGQYFRQWLVSEGLMMENAQPDEAKMRFYANSMQRTIATAQYFSSGMLPVANVRIEHHYPVGTMDPVFNPQLTVVSDTYREQALQQIADLFGEGTMAGIGQKVAAELKLVEKVVDLKDTQAYQEGGITGFSADDVQVKLELNAEPAMTGGLKTATGVADALVLQYYEESDEMKAAFGHSLTRDDWRRISAVKDWYGDVLFTAPLVAVNVAHPLLQEMLAELRQDGRQFTFLCGHDSNIGSVLAALGVEDAIVINPAAYTHTSVAILDALRAVALPAVEVHLSRISERESFRQISYTSLACEKTIEGKGFEGYREAIRFLTREKK